VIINAEILSQTSYATKKENCNKKTNKKSCDKEGNKEKVKV